MSNHNGQSLSPAEQEPSQFSLHTPVDAHPPNDSRYQPPSPSQNTYSSSSGTQAFYPGSSASPPPVSQYIPVHVQRQQASAASTPNMSSHQSPYVPSPQGSPPPTPGIPHHDQTEAYQMQPTPQPARSPPPTFEHSQQMTYPHNSQSPPPVFDLHAPAPAQFQEQFPPHPQHYPREGPQDFAPPPQQQYAPPPQQQPQDHSQQQFAPPPTQAIGEQPCPPMPPLPITTPTYNPSDSTGPKTPIYTPGGAAGPNGGIHAPGQIGHPNQQHGPQHYKHGLCDCFGDIGTCCTGYWCPCILYSRTYHRLKTAPNSNLNSFSSFNAHCGLFCIAAPISFVLTMLQRTRIRENYRLEGSVGDDCFKAYCCASCTLIQDDREVSEREDERRRFAGPGSGVVGDGGYRRNGGMVYG